MRARRRPGGSARSIDRTHGHAPEQPGGASITAAFALLGALLAAYLGLMIFRRSWQFSPLLDGWLIIAFQSAACALCIVAALRMGRHRRVALVMGTACISWTVGDLLFTLESLGGASPSTPSLADAFFLLFFPLAFIAVLLFVRGEITREDAPNWLDGAVAALGMAALCSAFALHDIQHLLDHPSLASATNLAFPAADVLLLGVVVGSTIFLTGRRRATLVLIALGIAVNATGDTINFVQPASGASQFSSVLNAVAWPFSIWVFALSMWVAERGSDRLAMKRLSGFSVPGLLAVSSLGILILDEWRHVPAPAVCLAAVTLVLAGVRLAFRPALRLARAQLRSSEERYRILFERNPLPMVTYDRRTLEIVAASNAMVSSYGYSREELHAMTISELRADTDEGAPATREASASLLAYGGHAARHRRKDGTVIEVEVTGDDVDLDGRACAIALYIDVTERNRMAAEAALAHDRAVEASNMKSAFLANVSHEIRTPMNAVIGMTELLLDMGLTSEQRACAEQVARSGGDMLALINDILDLSKIETGHLELDIVDFDLTSTIEEACAAAAVLATAKGLGLEVDIATGVPRRARGDGRRLRQVLANLLSNAVKFTATGSVSVSVSAASAPDAEGARVRLAVSDTGIGIDPAQLEQMFEPWTQADVSTTRVYGGTGLGLAIASEIVGLMGGTIGAESDPGRGSTFWFEAALLAPLTGEAQEQALRAAAALPAPSSWSRTPSVLVAEDSQINQIVAARAIERCGCRVTTVGDGAEALRTLAAHTFDLVLMDCQMPGMDGYEAAAELRRRERDGRRTPVIAMTAHAMAGDRERCLAAGMDDYITKPVRHAALAEALARWIPGSGESEESALAPDAGETSRQAAALR